MSSVWDMILRQHYKSEHWAPCRNQTPSWYDWKIVESDVKPEYTHTHRDWLKLNVNTNKVRSRCLSFTSCYFYSSCGKLMLNWSLSRSKLLSWVSGSYVPCTAHLFLHAPGSKGHKIRQKIWPKHAECLYLNIYHPIGTSLWKYNPMNLREKKIIKTHWAISDMRKPVFGVWDYLRLQQACSAS